MKTDYHNIMMTTLNLAVKECLKQNNLFDYQEFYENIFSRLFSLFDFWRFYWN